MILFIHRSRFKIFLLLTCLVLPATFYGQSISLVQPSDNIFLSDTVVSFTWNYSSTAVSYEFQLAQDAGFTSIVDSSSFVYITARVHSIPHAEQAYYWRVRYFDGAVYSGWSPVRTFTFFEPLDIAGLKMWLRSDAGITLSAGNVSQWDDLSGSGNDAAQTDTSIQPALILNAINNLPVVRFASDKLTTVSIDIGERTEFMLIRQNGLYFGNYHGILANLGDPYYQLYVGGSGTFNSYITAPIDHNSVFLSSYQYFCRVISTTNVDFYNNGTAGISGPHAASNTNQPIMIGNYGANYLNGDIAEIILYDHALPDSQRTKVQNYLNDRYAPPVNLGPDITTCAFPITLSAHQDYYLNYLWSDASTADTLVVAAAGDYIVTVTNIFGTITTDTVSVFFDGANFTVNLPGDTNICFGTTLTLVAGPPHLPYLWSTGSTSNYITVDTSGTYFVSVTDCNSNVTSDTITVTVVPLPVFSLGNDTLICFNQPLLLDPQLGNSITYLWSDSSTDSVLTVNTSGIYFLHVQDTIGCAYSDTVSIQVDSALATVSLGLDKNLCSGNTIALLSGAPAVDTYLWSDNSTDSTMVIQVSGTYWVNVTDTNGCMVSDTIVITIIGQAPAVNFSATTVCEGDSTNFTDLTTDTNVVSWTWNFGEPSSGANNFSALQHPSHLYADSGYYQVTLSDTANSGCYNDTTITIRVNPNPVPGFTLGVVPCSQTPLLFTNASDTAGTSVTSWLWNFGGGANDTSTYINPTHIFNFAGNYNVALTVTLSTGCSVSDTTLVTVLPAVIPTFSFFNTCIGQVTNFFTSVSGASLYWSFGDNSYSSQQNPMHQYANVNTFPCTLTAITMAGCTNSVTLPVVIHDAPVAHFRTSSACINVPYQLLDSSYVSQGTITQWLWSFPDFSSDTVQNPYYTFNDTLQHNITLIATSNYGCKDTVTRAVKVHPVPAASFDSDVSYGDAPLNVDFGNLSSGAASYLWDFGDASGTSALTNPSHTYTQLGTYAVMLVANTLYGCTDTAFKNIYVVVPVLDLSVTSVSTTTTANSIAVSAGIANLGNIAVSDFRISMQLENSLPVFENWNGNFIPQSTLQPPYNFAAHFETSPSNPPNVLCVEITEVNNQQDDNPSNNIRCINLHEDFVVMNPYPNPAEDVIYLQAVTTRKDVLSITIYDASGKLVTELFNGLTTTGLNKFIFDTSSLAEGTYFCRYSFSAKTIVKPLTHISKQK